MLCPYIPIPTSSVSKKGTHVNIVRHRIVVSHNVRHKHDLQPQEEMEQ